MNIKNSVYGERVRHTRMAAVAIVLLAILPAMYGAAAGSAADPKDFTGVWTRYPAFGQKDGDPKLVPPAPGKPPLKPEYAAAYEARKAAERDSDVRGQPLATRGTECLPYGMPVMMGAVYPIEILQTRGQVTILAEAMREVRRIYLGKPQLALDAVPYGYYGYSVGHWEGNTLLVDTIGILEKVLGNMDTPHSTQMHIRERMRLVAPDILHDEITIDDPVTLTQPWVFTFAYQRQPDEQMMEYVCDNNPYYQDEKGLEHYRAIDTK